MASECCCCCSPCSKCHTLYTSSEYWSQLYHTSKLTGEEWVWELICGHPNRICTELGVHCMFLLHLSLSYGAWDMEIQDMVSHLKSNLPSFSTCVSQVSVSNTLVSIFSDQMRLLQGKFHVSRLDSHTHKFTPDTSKRFAWHFHLKNSTPNMSSCHLHWIPLLSTFDIAKSSGCSLRSALEPLMDPILLHHHLPRIEPMHVTVKDHFHKMSLPSVPSQCNSYIC